MKLRLESAWRFAVWMMLLPMGCNDAAQQDTTSNVGAWSVEAIPSLEVGSDPANGLGHVIAATRLPDGTVVVADDMNNELSFFSATGARIASAGRAGMGPGEFRHIWWIGHCGVDSVYAWDTMRRMVTVWTSRGKRVREYTIPSPPKAGPPPFTITCSTNRVFAYQAHSAGPPPPTEASVARGTGRILLADASGSVKDMELDIPSGEMVVIGGGGGPRPLGKRTSIALTRDAVYIGTADSAYVDVFTHDGRRTAAISLESPSRPATRAHYNHAIEAITGSIHAPAVREMVQRSMLDLPMPDTLPPYTTLLTDPVDLLWVVLTSPGDAETRLRAVDASGRLIARVTVPVPLTVHEVGRDYVLASYEGHDGGPRVGAFELLRAQATPR